MSAASNSPKLDAESADKGEWTRVKSKSRYRKASWNVAAKSAALTHATSDEPRDGKSAADIKAEFEAIRTRWRGSEAHERLRNLILTNRGGCQTLKKAICLGIGTFDPEHGGWDATRRTYVQLIAFMDLVDVLSQSSGESISCTFQEPMFSSSDRVFVESLGFEVVETPAAFESVDEDSLLFAVHMYRPIYEAALGSRLPAMFVGTGWDTWDNVGNLKDGEFRCMRDMHKSHKMFDFPRDGTYNTFSSTCLYWRPRDEKDVPGRENGALSDLAATLGDSLPPVESETSSNQGQKSEEANRSISGHAAQDQETTRSSPG